MTSREIAEIAARQLSDYDRGFPGSIFAEGLTLSIGDAYAVQREIARLRRDRGEIPIGYKVGCTSPVIRRQLGIEHPVFGWLWSTERHESGRTLSRARFTAPAIEGELAVELAVDLAGDRLTEDEIRQAVGSVLAVIELHNAVFRGRDRTAAELIANNALHAGFVETPERFPLKTEADYHLEVQLDGVPVDRFSGRADAQVISSLRWLAAALADQGERLRHGDVVLTGSQARLIPIENAAKVAADSSSYGRAEVCFSE